MKVSIRPPVRQSEGLLIEEYSICNTGQGVRVPGLFAFQLPARALESIPMNQRVVIVGGGFGGLAAATGLRKVPVDVTLIDKRNIHVFTPLLYQVATGGLSPGDITSPLRGVLRRQRNATVWLGTVTGVDAQHRTVYLTDAEVPYDTLIVAAGAHTAYFGHPEWAVHAPALKTVEDAVEMRRRILLAFEKAERTTDPVERRALLTFVVVGAGPTGVELAGALSELARDTLRRDFRAIDPSGAQIMLVEGGDRCIPAFPARLPEKCARHLERMGVHLLFNTMITGIDTEGVDVRRGDTIERIPARTVLWAAGVRGVELGQMIAKATGATLDRGGRVVVTPELTVPDHPDIHVVGDLALALGPNGEPLPGIAPVAMQQGRYVAKSIAAGLSERAATPFRYKNKGQLATIGRAAAVADLGPHLRFSGYPAWLLWLFVHILYLIEFQNRLLVLFQWTWSYFTWNRGARIITTAPPTQGPSRDRSD